MIEFEDFMPHVLEKGFFQTKYEDLTQVHQAANTWIDSRPDIEVVNIETVVLPNMYDRGEEGSTDTSLRVSDDFPSTWHQVIRVWYRKKA